MENLALIANVNSTLISQIDYSGIGSTNHGFIGCQSLQKDDEH
jgi:hypothetical protein